MAGARGGVAAKIQQIEPKAVFTHCYGHALNLSVNDTIERSATMRDCLDTYFVASKMLVESEITTSFFSVGSLL